MGHPSEFAIQYCEMSRIGVTLFMENQLFRKWVSLSAALGFAVFLVYLFFFTDIAKVAGVLESTNITIYATAFVSVLLSITFDALAWRQLLKNLGIDGGFRRTFNLTWVGNFVDTLVPGGWSGDIFKAYLLSKEAHVDGAKAAASIVIKNVFESLIAMSFLIAGMVLLLVNYAADSGVIMTVGTLIFLLTLPLVIVVILSTNMGATEKLVRSLKRLTAKLKGEKADTSGFEVKIKNSLNEFHEGIMTIKTRPRSMVKPLILQVSAWAFDVLALSLIFTSLGSFIGLDKILITYTIVNNIQGQGVALAGVAQVVSSAIYTALGISSVFSIASSLLAGFASFWFKTIISFFAFQCTVSSHCIPGICRKCESTFGKKSCKDPRLSTIDRE